jgi:dolichyl-phosphate-mannose-protein mannosyltransferase
MKKENSSKETKPQSHAISKKDSPQRWSLLMALLLVMSAVFHFIYLTEPASVVFDEVHFGKFSSAYCCTRENFFDIHPPHAKMLIAAPVSLTDYKGDFDFKDIAKPFTDDVPAFVFRFVPAFVGVALTLIVFVLIRQLGGSEAAAFLGAALYTFDNAFLVQTRHILLDGILLLAIFSSVSAYLGAMQTENAGKRVGLLLLAGAMAGLAVGSKHTGLTALGLIAVIIMVRIIQDFNGRNALKWLRSYIWVASGAVAVYLLGWYLHFVLLSQPGYGDAFYQNKGHFFEDVLSLHRVMLSANFSITVPHPDASPWWSWPLMVTPPYYWGQPNRSIYFLGNPIVWWGATLLMIVAACNIVLSRVSNLSWQQKKPSGVNLWIPFIGYLIATLPYALVSRGLFMYHYLPPLIFSLIFVVLWLDSAGWIRSGGFTAQRKTYFAVLAVSLSCFLFLSSVTYGYEHPPWYPKVLSKIFPRVTQ